MQENRNNQTNAHPAPLLFMNQYLSWLVLAIGIIITLALTLTMKADVEIRTRQEFREDCLDLQNKILERLAANSRILQSGAGLFNVKGQITRSDWRIFIQTQKIENQFPGIQGTGFSLLIPQKDLKQHILQIRKEGFPTYNIRPAGDRELYSSIIYLEPFSGRNLRAFGYDMFSEPVRRKAMERARDTDNAALSGKVILVQETEKNIQAGTLMYVPVYRKGMPIDTIQQRRTAIYGWVYSPYRMNDLMLGILGHQDLNKEKLLQFQIFEGEQPSTSNMLYDSQLSGEQKVTHYIRMTNQLPIDFNGMRWTLRLIQTSKDFAPEEYTKIWLVIIGGTFITILLFALIRSLLSTRTEAQRIAESLTSELKTALIDSQRYRGALDQVQAYVFIKDLECRYVYANKSPLELFSCPPEEIVGSDDTKYFAPDTATRIKAIDMRVLQGTQSTDELPVTDKEGNQHIFLYVKTPIFAEPDKKTIVGLLGISTDITEMKRMEEKLHNVQKLESLGVLAGGIAHDFNNLMVGIYGYIDLAGQAQNMAKVSVLLSKAMSTIDRARGLTSQLLTFAQGGAPIQIATPLFPFIQEKVQDILEGSNVLCHYFISDNLWPCNIDKIQIGQVIDNLISNAYQAMPLGGTIDLTAENVTFRNKEHLTLAQGNYVKISIKDFGIGMSKELMLRIFDPYFTTKEKGRGLGLATCYSIIKRHGGTIEAQSEPGKGSTFHVILPATEMPAIDKHPVTTLTHTKPEKILIMDDEEYILEIETLRLRKMGYTVVATKNSKEAILEFEKAIGSAIPFDVVILDLTIPGGPGGIQTLSIMKKINDTVNAIVSSGYSEDPVMINPKKYGFIAALKKPYNRTELEEIINQVQK